MKRVKTFLMATLIALVAILSVACNDKPAGGQGTSSVTLSPSTSSSVGVVSSSGSINNQTSSSSQIVNPSTQESGTIKPSSSSSAVSVCNHAFTQTSNVEPTTSNAGYRAFKCGLCQETFTSPIPKLDDVNYSVTTTEATCEAEGMAIYSSGVYGSFSVKTADKLKHSAYNGDCISCGKELFGNLQFDQNNARAMADFGAGPRILKLKNGDLLVAIDNGANVLSVVRSSDGGDTWSENSWVVEQVEENNLAANTTLYQFDNGDIICAYRIHGTTGKTGANEQKYIRKIVVKVSKDNGYTWQYHSTVVDVYDLGYTASQVNSAIEELADRWVGVYEPCFNEIDGKLTVMWADDFSSHVLYHTHEAQYIRAATWNEATSSWTDYRVCLDGYTKKTVGGENMQSRDGMPVFDQLSDGTVVLVTEGTYLRNASIKHPFIICMSYSKDGGKTFSTPVAIYVPRTNNAKAAAPYVCVTDDDRIIVSFQTEEDVADPGNYNVSQDQLPDTKSVMKIMVSDGTPVDKITGQENFLPPVIPFGTKIEKQSTWNGMLLDGDTLYCVTGSNWNADGGYCAQMQKTTVPKCEWLNYESCASDISAKNGNFTVDRNKFTTTQGNTLITSNTQMYNGSVSVDMVQGVRQDSALIFRISANADNYWEEKEKGVSYYLFMINSEGQLFFARIENGWSIMLSSQLIRNTYDPTKGYSLKAELNDDVITCYLNGSVVLSYKDETPLTGTGVGVRAAVSGCMFWNLNVNPKDN